MRLKLCCTKRKLFCSDMSVLNECFPSLFINNVYFLERLRTYCFKSLRLVAINSMRMSSIILIVSWRGKCRPYIVSSNTNLWILLFSTAFFKENAAKYSCISYHSSNLDDAGYWNPHWWETRACLACIINTITADDMSYDDVIKWNIFHITGPLCEEFTGHLHKGQWRGSLMFSLICAWINCWVNRCEAGHWDPISVIMTFL